MKILYYQKWRCFMCMVALKRHSTQTLLHVKQEIALQDAIAVGLAVPVVPEGLEPNPDFSPLDCQPVTARVSGTSEFIIYFVVPYLSDYYVVISHVMWLCPHFVHCPFSGCPIGLPSACLWKQGFPPVV